MSQKRKKGNSSLLLEEYAARRIELKKGLSKAATAELYQVAVGHFIRFVGDPGFRMGDLSKTQVSDFIAYLQSKRLATNTINSYLSNLRAIYNAACHDGLLQYRDHPFEGLRLRRESTVKRAISMSFIQKLANLKVEESSRQELAVDLCLFSFLACGMPFIDIAYLTPQNIHNNELVYNRRKSGAQIRMEITTGMWQLIHKYAPTYGEREFLFPILPMASPTHAQYKNCLAMHNRELKEIGDRLEIPIRLTSYVMRHSWASIALRCGVSIAIISQALGHSSEKTTRIYLNELDISELAEANQKVSGSIDLLLKDMEKRNALFMK
ncbi:tyrosine-type recombinase/integrase [Parabacteroides timonensis]|uniref:tyrosine-type recombinase/integrase n=1 Tax=Parabacteroides timonensis TaxID=1871013 RepID=UPI00094E39AD|nr:site-specific integrase [Parabacteroides timonensis]